LLAAAFPNATYMGYPVLINTLGESAGSIAIQYDLFACTPLLLTLGVVLAAHYGEGNEKPNPLMLLVKVPPLWAALIATLLNISGVAAPVWLSGLFSMMGDAVVPLMLFAIGLALKQGFREIHHLTTVIPVMVIKLVIMPLVALAMSYVLFMEGEVKTAVILEAAMPSMVLGIVLCDRYGLNSGIYAAAVTATTVLSLFTLPLWFSLVQ
ncbi:MAG: AEC family transporter, partial [Gammaproteobacteria bacterium]|nr:AEC family transporter [Gammaproteobacteria bacterium]